MPRTAPARSEPVLLAGRRGDGAAADRAVRGAGRGHRREGRHRRSCTATRTSRGGWSTTASRSCACPRRRSSARSSSLVASNYVTYLGERALRRAARSAPGRRALHDRSADRRRHRAARGAALPRAARRDQPGRLPRDRRASSSGSRIRVVMSLLRGLVVALSRGVPTVSSRSATRCATAGGEGRAGRTACA